MPHFRIIDTSRHHSNTDSGNRFDFNFAPNEPEQTREHILMATKPGDEEAAMLLPAVQSAREAARRRNEPEDDSAFDTGDFDGEGQVGMSYFLF